MKKINFITLTLFMSICVSLILSSCLGEGKGYYRGSSEFSYIAVDSMSNFKYARTEGLNLISFPGIEEFKSGDCAFISYSFDEKSEEKILSNGFTVHYSKLINDIQKIESVKAVSMPKPDVTDTLYFSSIGVQQYHSSKYFGDNYLLRYTVPKSADEKQVKSLIKCYISINENIKADSNKDADEGLPKSDVIVDIRLEENAENGVLRSNDSFVAIDLSEIRILKPNLERISISFRYFKEGSKKPVYINKMYFMKLIE